MTHKTHLDVWPHGGTRVFRGTCPCGWESEWTQSWRDATRDIDMHELEAAVARHKNSIQEGVDEATEQGQTSDTQHNTR